MARVVIAVGYGGPEVLSVTEELMPDPGPGEARMEVRAVGVNPLDLARLAGERKLRVIVSQTFRLAEAAAAHRVVREGHTTGKIALIP